MGTNDSGHGVPRARVRKALAAFVFMAVTLALGCVRPAEMDDPGGDSAPPGPSVSDRTAAMKTSPITSIATEEAEMDAESWFAGRVGDIGKHAAIVASLDPGRTVARLNPDTPFNPASLIKLATSLAALKKLGPDHRFDIHVYADGVLRDGGTFDGDLYFSGSTPSFDQSSADAIREELRRRGVEKITGRVYISPLFGYRYVEDTVFSAGLLSKQLFPGRTPGAAIADRPSGKEIFVFRSHPLVQVLLFQNTFSANTVAHRIGDAVGGPDGVRRYLVEELGLPPGTVKLETTSGLGENSMTARGIFAVLRELDRELARHGLKPEDIMPVADEERSTVSRRLHLFPYPYAIVGKTGTLSAADGGVGMASLAGYIHNGSGKMLAFVLMDEGAAHRLNGQLQEQFLFDALHGRIEFTPVEIERPRETLPPSGLTIEPRAEISH